MEAVVRAWAKPVSWRTDPAEAALEVVTIVAQQLKQVVGQQPVEQDGYGRATMQLLRAVPIEGKLITMDAGLLHRSVVKTIVSGGGDNLGSLRCNEPEVKQVVETWLQANLSPSRPATSG